MTPLFVYRCAQCGHHTVFDLSELDKQCEACLSRNGMRHVSTYCAREVVQRYLDGDRRLRRDLTGNEADFVTKKTPPGADSA